MKMIDHNIKLICQPFFFSNSVWYKCIKQNLILHLKKLSCLEPMQVMDYVKLIYCVFNTP